MHRYLSVMQKTYRAKNEAKTNSKLQKSAEELHAAMDTIPKKLTEILDKNIFRKVNPDKEDLR